MASIQARQIDFLKSKFLQTLGQEREELPVIQAIITDYAKLFLDEAAENLNKTNTNDTGTLNSELTFTVEKNQGGYIVSIGYPVGSKAAEYYDFINKGVAGVGKSTGSPYSFKTKNPSQKHISAIEQWLKRGKAKITATDVQRYGPTRQESKSYRFREQNASKSLAYIVARSTKIKGIKATRYFDDAITAVFGQDFIDIMSKALAADVALQITQTKN